MVKTVIFSNDGEMDAYAADFAMALCSAGEINLVGIVPDAGAGNTVIPNEYPIIFDYGKQEYEEAVGKARRSGMLNTPPVAAGAHRALDRPASGLIDDTTPYNLPGSQMIINEANKRTTKDPLYICTGGALTAVANAYLIDPTITDKIVVMSIMGDESSMNGYNCKIDTWAAYIVLTKFEYIQFQETKNKPKITKEELAGLGVPESEMKRFMIAKDPMPGTYAFQDSCDTTPLIGIMRDDFITSSKKVSFSHWEPAAVYGNSYPFVPFFKDDPDGSATIVLTANVDVGTNEFWRGISNPAAYKGTIIQQSPSKTHAIPGTIDAVDFDNGGLGVAFYNQLPASWWLYRLDLNMDSNYLDANVGLVGDKYVLKNISSGDWWKYTVDISEPGDYDISVDLSNAELSIGGKTFTDTVHLEAGTHIMKISATSDATEFGEILIQKTQDEPVIIPHDELSIIYVDSEETTTEIDGSAANVLDGKPGTYWHTEWAVSKPPHPHEIQVNLGRIYDVSGFRYLPRQDISDNGNIKDFEFYVSNDVNNWGAPVVTGTLINQKPEQVISFEAKQGRYIKFVALSEFRSNGDVTSISELNIFGVPCETKPCDGIVCPMAGLYHLQCNPVTGQCEPSEQIAEISTDKVPTDTDLIATHLFETGIGLITLAIKMKEDL